jgi:ABC-type transport system substrate-binding protein
MKKIHSRKIIFSILFILIIFLNVFVVSAGVYRGMLANLVLKTTGGNIKPSYGLFIAKYLKEEGIEVEIQIEEHFIFMAQVNYTHNYDMFIADYDIDNNDFNMFDIESPVFDEIEDPFGIHISNWSRWIPDWSSWLPYVDVIDPLHNMRTFREIVEEISNSTDQLEIQELYYNLQELCMDKIIPFLPLFWKNDSASFSYLGFNSRRPFLGLVNHFRWLDSPGKEEYTIATAIRKAICYTIDRKEMNKELHNNEYEIVHSIFSPSYSLWYHNEIMKYQRNPEIADEWLEAAGYYVPDYANDGGWFWLGFMIVGLPIIIGTSIVALILVGIAKAIDNKLKRRSEDKLKE